MNTTLDRYEVQPVPGSDLFAIYDAAFDGLCTLPDNDDPTTLLPLEWSTQQDAQDWLDRCLSTWNRCVGCSEPAPVSILVRIIEQGSGPGHVLYACTECAPQYMTQQHAMQELFEHTQRCSQCAQPAPSESCLKGRALVRVHSRTLRSRPPKP